MSTGEPTDGTDRRRCFLPIGTSSLGLWSIVIKLLYYYPVQPMGMLMYFLVPTLYASSSSLAWCITLSKGSHRGD